MRNILAGFGCVILLLLFLPLGLIFIGPLLVLAVVRGRQPVGPITLNTLRYGPLGRLGALLLGMALWLLVWSGLGWVFVNGFLAAPPVVDMPSVTPAAVVSSPVPTMPAKFQGETPLPSPTTASTPTPLPPIEPSPPEAGSETSTPTPLALTPSPTSRPGSTPVVTVTMVVSTPTPSAQPASASNSGQTTLKDTISLTSPLTLAGREAAVATVKEGNRLLREAISLANQDNLQKLDAVWQGQALTKAQNFAADIYRRYAKPFDVQFEYLTPPTLGQNLIGQVIIVSQETWIYQGRSGVERDSFEFTYTLTQENDRWFITQYSYHNLSLPAPTATPGE